MIDLIIIDPGLFLPVGHHIGYDTAISKVVKRLGGNAPIFSWKKAEDLHVRTTSIPFFSHGLYTKIAPSDLDNVVRLHVTEVCAVLNQFDARSTAAFFPNASLIDVLALSKILDDPPKNTSYHLMLRFADVSNYFSEGYNSETVFNDAVFKLQQHTNCRLYTDTEALKHHWCERSIATDLAPVPIANEITFENLLPSPDFEVVSLGQTGMSKGLGHIINSMFYAKQLGLNPHTFIQTTFHYIPDEITLNLPNITFNRDPLSQGDYQTRLRNSWIYINAYDPSAFQHGSSNALLEAAIAGKIILATDFPWSRATVLNDIPEYRVEFTAESLAERLAQFLVTLRSNTAFLEDRRRALSRKLRRLHSPEALVAKILSDSINMQQRR